MLNRTYPDQDCSIARTLEVIGERWSLLIMRDAFFGVHRFDDFQERLGIARNVLATRLAHLCESGLIERRPYSEHASPYFHSDIWIRMVCAPGLRTATASR